MQVPHIFTPGTVISSSEVNENFELFEDALDKTGDDMEGDLGSHHIIPITDSTYNLGSTTRAFANVFTDAIRLTDTDGSHHLAVVAGSNLTADRTLTITTGDVDVNLSFPIPMSLGGLGTVLTDPDNDRILFWDDSLGAFDWLIAGSGLSIVDKTISGSGGSGLTITGTDHRVLRMDGTNNIQDSAVELDDSGNISGVGTLGVTGAATFGSTLALTGNLTAAGSTILTPDAGHTLSSGNNNNLAIDSTATIIPLNTSAGSCVLTGIAGGTTGRVIGLVNIGSGTLTFSGQSASSDAANRIYTSSTTIGAGSGAWLVYIGTASRWFYLGGTA